MTNPINQFIKEAVEYLREEYLDFTDAGVYGIYAGKTQEIDIDDYFSQKLQEMAEVAREEERKSIIKFIRDIKIKNQTINWDSIMSPKIEVLGFIRQTTRYVWEQILKQLKSKE
jgi:hypothetical protein